MAAISRVQNVYVIAADLVSARRFYEEGLGMSVKFSDAGKWLQLTAGDTNFAVSSPDEGGAGMPSAIVVFETDNLEEAKSQIQTYGGLVVSERDMGSHGRTVMVKDPFGNALQLFARTRPA